MNKEEPAFPVVKSSVWDSRDIAEVYSEGGLSKREYFALHIYCAKITSPIMSEALKYAARIGKSPDDISKELIQSACFEANELLTELERMEKEV